MLHLLHLLGSYPLIVGMVSQVIVLVSSLRDKDKSAVTDSLLLMGALGLIMVSVMMRPKSPPNPAADVVGFLGAVLLLTPGIQALLKLRQAKAGKGEKEAAGQQ